MSATEQSLGSLSGLTDRELEVLRLLAAGHTAKTIATRLGRSETSINERLRAARRKTGVGSSRELARLLEAQKNRDKNIDLSAPRFAPDTAGEPETVGFRSAKGMIAMLVTLPVVALGLIVAADPATQQAAPTIQQTAAPPTAHAAASQTLPLVGRWSLDVARIPQAERPQSVTMTFRVSPDGKWTSLVEIVAPDGASTHAESTAALDGVPVPISGNMDFIDTVALRQPAPNTLVMTLGKNGAPLSTRVYTIAKDQKSMTETIVWAGDTVPELETTHFNRID